MGSPALQLPDTRRDHGLHRAPGRPLTARSLKLALSVAHTCLGPRKRERFVEEPAPRAVERIPYQSDDGWQCFLFRCPPPPGATGEPVVLAHGLGLNRLSMDYAHDGLVALLHAWGFDVYLLEHRADASSFPPRNPRRYDADTIAAQDIPAAIQAVLDHSGHERVGWVGHGFGGQLLYLHLAMDPYAPVYAAACLGSAVRFASPGSTARVAALISRMLPQGLGLPSRQVLRLLSPSAYQGNPLSMELSTGGIAGPVLRGVLNHGVEDLHGGLVRQVSRWISSGVLCDRDDRIDYLEALRGHELPLMVVASPGDTVCEPESALRVLDYMGESGKRSLVLAEPCSHLELVQGRAATQATGPAVAGWLDAHRRRAW
jgi:pimeloyl-ACP methyl ester carboxylesterase